MPDRDAIERFRVWRQPEDEPNVSLKRGPIKISAVCRLVMNYSDPMPDAILLAAHRQTHEGIEPTDWYEDRSYRNGARHLLKLIKHRETTRRP